MEGTTFRHLRQLLGLTLSQTAKNICSVAALSRWETGQTEIPFNIAIKLLAKIQVNTGEFLTWQKKTNIFSQGLKTLIKALDTENIPLIKRETSK